MTREVPDHVKIFNLTGTSSSSVTYHFRPDKGSGWALATVNDATGELAIQSDWGNWSYRWPAMGMPEHDGRRITLTEFIADRDSGHCDYLADKLTSYEERHVFDEYESARSMQRTLIEMRLKQGREIIDYYADEDPEDREDVGTDDPRRYGPWEKHEVRCKYTHRDEDWYATKQAVRTMYDELDGLKGENNQDHFLTTYFKIHGHEIISDEPWHSEHLIHRPSPHYYQLLHGILPALVKACEKTVRERTANTPCKVPVVAVAS